MATGIHAVEFEVAPGPVQIRVREIDAGAGFRASGSRIHRETSAITEKIEHMPAGREALHQSASLTMVEEKSGVQVVGEVDDEAMASLGHDEVLPARTQFAVLGRGPLTVTLLDNDLFGRKFERLRRGPLHGRAPIALRLQVCDRRAVLLQLGALAIQIERERKLGDVAVVYPEALDSFPPGPLAQVPIVFGHAVPEHLGLLG